jgi:two-component system, NtrC family, sensor histidine kinase HydH
VPPSTVFDELKWYVGFDESSSALLREAHPLVEGALPSIVESFYLSVVAHSPTRAVVAGGRTQIERLKGTLRRWLEEVFLGPHDDEYYRRRMRIGAVHVQVNLPQAYMFAAMNRIRVPLAETLQKAMGDDQLRMRQTLAALHQILDMELAIMLETYRDDLLTKQRAAERLATIGQFAAGIGHELRNPLAIVDSSLFLLRQRFVQIGLDDAHLLKHLNKMQCEVRRATKIISDLLELARNRPPRCQPVTAASVIQRAIEAALLPVGVIVDVNVTGDLLVNCDADQICCLLSNLLTNASDAMNGEGYVRVVAGAADGTAAFQVTDEGPGVPDEARDRMFEPLFTTKSRGSGLGLPLCRRIAEAHGGTLVLEPSGRGASFVLRLPDQPTA